MEFFCGQGGGNVRPARPRFFLNKRASLAAFAIYSVSFCASAQQTDDLKIIQQQTDHITQQQQQRLEVEREEQIRKQGRTLLQPSTESSPSAEDKDADALCFQIDHIEITGTSFPVDIHRLVQSHENRCLTLSGINAVVKSITLWYLDRGFVTSRAYLPEQDLKSKILQIKVIEGILEGFDGSKAPNISPGTAFPGMPGGMLSLRDIEQGVEQINRLASNNVTVNLLPGDQVGSSVLQLSNDPGQVWAANYRHDNSGQKSTGERQNRVFISLDNPFALNDYVSIYMQADTRLHQEGKESENLAFRYEIPYGYWLYSLDISRFDYLNQVAGESQSFVTSGTSDLDSFTASVVMARNQDSKTEVVSSITRKANKNFVEGVLLDSSSRILTVGEIQLRHKLFWPGNQTFDMSIGYKRGLPWLNSVDALGSDGADPEYNALTAGFNFSTPFNLMDIATWYRGDWAMQYSNDTLFGSEKFAIGGLYSVRGFKEESLSSRTGLSWRNELSFPRSVMSGFAGIKSQIPFVAFDYGIVKGDPGLESTKALSGISLGIRFAGTHVSGDITIAKALERPKSFTEADQQIYFSITISL